MTRLIKTDKQMPWLPHYIEVLRYRLHELIQLLRKFKFFRPLYFQIPFRYDHLVLGGAPQNSNKDNWTINLRNFIALFFLKFCQNQEQLYYRIALFQNSNFCRTYLSIVLSNCYCTTFKSLSPCTIIPLYYYYYYYYY